MTARTHRILVVDDDPLFREAAVLALRGAGLDVHAAASTDEADAQLSGAAWDLVIADIHMPGNERLQWVRGIAQPTDGPAVLLCTGFPAIDTAIDAVALPVLGYLVKPVPEARLLAEVGRALAHPRSAPPDAASAPSLRDRLVAARKRHEFTNRQMEVLELLADGKSNREIAGQLQCAVRTVELHVSELLRKTGASSRTALLVRVLGDTGDDRQ